MKKVAILFIILLTSSFVFAQNTYVPDDNFEQALIDLGYDTTLDDSVLTANISGVTSLDVSNKEISDLTGIEAFTALTELVCSSNKLTSLDVSANTALTHLYCGPNELTSLDVSANTALTKLHCGDNKLTSLDVSKNTVLENLWCGGNKLTSLDVSKNTALWYLDCAYNELTSLDVNANTALVHIDVNNNQITSLDVSQNTALIYFNSSRNQLTNIDVSNNLLLDAVAWETNLITNVDISKNTALTWINLEGNQLSSIDITNNIQLNGLLVGSNQLTSLDVTNNTALIELNVHGNQLTSLDVSKNTALETLECYNNQLTALDVSQNTALKSLWCSDNQLTSLDVSNNTALTALDIGGASFTNLDVSNNTALTYLGIIGTQLTSLDVSNNIALEYLYSRDNQLTSLDVTNNTALIELKVNGNKLTSLDVSKNTVLTWLYIKNNQLTYLNMRNGVTDGLTTFDATDNSLTCIEVLDPAYATANWTSAKENIDAGVTFAYICGVDVDGVATYNNNGIKAITFNVELPTHSLPDTNISLAFWKSGAESNECTGCNGRDTVSMRKLSDDHWEAIVGLDTTLVAGDVGESMYWYHYVKTIPDYKINEDSERFKSEPNPDGLRQLEPGWHKETSLVNKDTVIAWNNIAPVNFDWVSAASDTIKITLSNLADTYTLQWSASTDVDGDSINYLLYAQIGVYPAEEIYDTTSTSVPITYQEILEGVFEGSSVNGATVRFNVKATDGVDTVDVTGDNRVIYVNRYEYLSTESEAIPTEFALHENYPNPFNPTTTLRFDLLEVSSITLTIYNMLGQKVRTFNMNDTPAGFHSIKWNATNDYGDPVGAGVYLYQLRANQYVKTRKMVLLK